MSPNINTSTVSGNVTRDPEWKAFDDDNGVVNFSVAVNRRWYNKKTEEYVEEVSFIDAKCFGGFGKLIARKVKKGDSLTITGELRQENWEQEGVKRSKLVLHVLQADGDAFFRAKGEENSLDAASSASESAPAAAPAAATDSNDDIPF